MTELTDNNEIPKLDAMPEALHRFILHWGDMGSTWGVNRTVAQIHALLYVSEHPLHAEQIADCLGVARSNVCLLYTSPSPRDKRQSRMPSSA